MEVGGKPVNHGAANTLPFEEAVTHLRGAVMALLKREREGERKSECPGRKSGANTVRENDLLNWEEKSFHFPCGG